MRFLTFLLLAALPFGVAAQKKSDPVWPSFNIDSKTELISYNEVPEVSGATASELYDRTMKWGSDYYKNFGEKVRKQDKEAGEIEIFARFPIYAYDKKGVKTASQQGLIQYTLTILFKDGRYKLENTKLNHKEVSYQPLELWLDKADPDAVNHAFYLTDIDAEMKTVISSLKAALADSGDAGGDDW